MGHGARERIHVDCESVDCHISEHVVDVEIFLEIGSFADVLQCGHDATVVAFARAGYFRVPDRGIAFEVVIGIVQVGAASAHGESAACIVTAHFHGVRLIELAVTGTEIPEHEALFHGLQGEVDTPIFAVD